MARADGVRGIERRRFLRLALLGIGGAALGGLAAACTSQPAPPAAAPAKTGEKPAAASAPQQAAPATGAGQPSLILRLNQIEPSGQEFANKFIADYSAQNNVKIEIDYTDWATSFQKITTGIAAGTAPDIWMAGGLWTPVLASKNATLELDDYIKSMPEWSDWYDYCRQDVTYNGKIHGIPYRTNLRGSIVYRKSLFEKAGLDPSKPPTTWDEAHAMAAKLTQKEGDKITTAGWHIVFAPADLTQQYEDALFQMGGNYFNEDRTKPLNDTPEGEAALQFWVHFVEKGIVPKEGMDSGVPNLYAYTAGLVAMYPGWPQDLANTRLHAPQIWEDTLTAPPLKQKEQRLQVFVDKFQISKRTKFPDQAFALTRALVSEDTGIKLGVEGTGGMPVRKAHEAAPSFQDPRIRRFVDNLQFGKARQVVPQHFEVQPAMSRHVEEAIKGVKPVKQALKEMDETVLKILKG